MKIACFCEHWGSGGIESFLTSLLESIDMEGLEIDLIVNRKDPSIFDTRLDVCSVNIIILTNKKEPFFINHLKFIQWIQKNNYHAVHLNIYHGFSLIYLMYASIFKIPIRIAHSHNNDLRKSSTKRIKMMVHTVSKYIFQGFATKRWACSKAAGNFLYHKKDFQVIKNGINVDTFVYEEDKRRNMRSTLQIESKFVLGHVGRLVYQKNQSFLLDILSAIKQRGHPVTLLLVGEGEDRTSLEKKTEQLGLKDDVIFYHTSKEMQGLLSAMDVYVFPSIFEAFGITMIEAQANGLPVVCSSAIPLESRLTSRVQVLSLQDSAEVWAEVILSQRRDGNERAMREELSKKGYQMSRVVSEIKSSYLGEWGEAYPS